MIENYEENSSVPSNNNSENISSSSQNKIGNPLGTETAATLSDRTKSTQSTKTAGTSNRKPETGDNKSFSTKASGSETSTSFKTTERKSNGILLSMTDGSSRLLISPSDPSISLSEHASNTISEDITVRIIFNISDNGNVPAYGIMISPKLNQTVMNEILSQISKWKFESSFSDSTCSFDFSIRLKY